MFASVLFCHMCVVYANRTIVFSFTSFLVFLDQNEDAGRSLPMLEIFPMKNPRQIRSIVLAAKSYLSRMHVCQRSQHKHTTFSVKIFFLPPPNSKASYLHLRMRTCLILRLGKRQAGTFFRPCGNPVVIFMHVQATLSLLRAAILWENASVE